MRQLTHLVFVFALLAGFVAMPSTTQAQDLPIIDSDDCDNPESSSLRGGIESFNNGSPITEIGLPGAIYQLDCELVVTNTERSLTIKSPFGGPFKAAPGSRVLHVAEGATVILEGVPVTGGDVDGNGGGILNEGTLILKGSTISGNTATGHGGGIYSSGTLHITDGTVISGNTGRNGGAIFADHGSTLTIDGGSELSDNKAVGNGAGLYSRAELHIANSSLIDNRTTDSDYGLGGGILIVNDDADGVSVSSTISASTMAGNDARFGGGINIQGPNAVVSVTNTTIHGNSADITGGGISVDDRGSTVAMRSVTISGNRSPFGGGLSNLGGDLTVTSSIVAGNTLLDEMTENNVEGEMYVDGGHNFIDGDPLLHTLADNGGSTQTMLPQEDSPVVNAGGDSCLATDQRGFTRPAGTACDIGAVEVQWPTLNVPSDMTVEATSPEGATVDFSAGVSATDWDGNPIDATCDAISGSHFDVGPTTVSCFTSDAVDYDVAASFSVTVLPFVHPLTALIEEVRDGPSPQLVKPRLLIFLETAQQALDRDQTAAACSLLDSFSAGLETYRNAGLIQPAIASGLLADAEDVRAGLGCQ